MSLFGKKANKTKETSAPAHERDADIGLDNKDTSTNSAGGDNARAGQYGSGNSSAWDTSYGGGATGVSSKKPAPEK